MKRLQHKRYALAIANNEDIRIMVQDIEMFDLSYDYKNEEGYNVIIQQVMCDDSIKFELSVNYDEREVLLKTNEYSQEMIDLTMKYYTEKGYGLTIKEDTTL